MEQGYAAAVENNAWFQHQHVDGVENMGLELELLGDVDLWNQGQWLDTVVTEQGLLSDSMYGLFTPNDLNTDFGRF